MGMCACQFATMPPAACPFNQGLHSTGTVYGLQYVVAFFIEGVHKKGSSHRADCTTEAKIQQPYGSSEGGLKIT